MFYVDVPDCSMGGVEQILSALKAGGMRGIVKIVQKVERRGSGWVLGFPEMLTIDQQNNIVHILTDMVDPHVSQRKKLPYNNRPPQRLSI